MLKKTGGLSFKPKVAPRRPGAASSSQAPPASSSTTPAPTTETSSQASTPAPSVPPPASSVTPSVEPGHKAGETQEKLKEVIKETPGREPERPSIRVRHAPTAEAVSEPITTSTTSPVPVNEPAPQAPTAPTLAPTQTHSQPTLAPAADDPQQSHPVSVLPTVEQAIQPPTPEVLISSTPPSTQPAKTTPSTSSAVPTVATPRPPPVTSAPTPGPSAPAQIRVAPPTAPPSPAPVSDTIAVSTPADEAPTIAPKKRTYKRKSTAAADGTGVEGPAPKKRRPRKTATTVPAETETTESSATPSAGGEGEAAPPKRTYRRRKRSPTPEDPENQVVDHTKTKMGDLTKDLGIGKRFKHADAIEERAREARERFRRKKLEKQKRALGITADEDSASRAGTPAEGEGEGEENERESALARARDLGASVGANAQSVGYEVVDGQIIISQQSLVVDRHAAHRNTANLETVEEDEFSHLTTSASFRRESRKTGPNHWTDEDTEKFYRLLGMFGTDFETIAAMFPEKSRRAVKLKFNREENLRPRRINATVMVRGEKKVNIDLEEYKAHQTEWQESDKIMAEHAKLVKEHNEDLRRLKEERRAQGLFDEEDELENGENSQEGDADNATGNVDTNEEENADPNAMVTEVAVEA